MPYEPAGFTLYYGLGTYGQNVYGQNDESLTTGIYNEQKGYCPTYLRMQFSGVTLPLYVFDINPTQYDAYPQRNTQSYKTILDFDPTVDQDYKKFEITLTWDEIPELMWSNLLLYSRKKVDGTSEQLEFWDGSVGRFRETKVHIESLKGQVSAGYGPDIPRKSVSLKLIEV